MNLHKGGAQTERGQTVCPWSKLHADKQCPWDHPSQGLKASPNHSSCTCETKRRKHKRS